MSQNTELSKILEKIISEVSDVRKSIEDVKKNIKKEKNSKKLNKNIEEDLVSALLKSNLELHAKISELVIILNSLSKDIKSLLDIFKEAALVYMESGSRKKEIDLSKKIEELEAQNKRIYEIMDKLIKEIEDLKKDRKEERTTKQALPPPPIPPPRK